MKIASIHRRRGTNDRRIFLLRWPNKAVHFHRPAPFRSLVSLRVLEILFHIDRARPSNDKRFIKHWFPREIRTIRVIRLCNIIVGPHLLPHPHGGMEWSTIAILRGSGMLARDSTSRKLNTSIFSMFTVEESLFNHGNVEWRIKRRESQKYTDRYTIRHNIDHIYDINSVMKWANKQSNNSFNYQYVVCTHNLYGNLNNVHTQNYIFK